LANTVFVLGAYGIAAPSNLGPGILRIESDMTVSWQKYFYPTTGREYYGTDYRSISADYYLDSLFVVQPVNEYAINNYHFSVFRVDKDGVEDHARMSDTTLTV